MSVLDQRYRRWQGQPVPHLLRVLTIPRYALGDLFRRKAVLVVSALAMLPSVGLAGYVYLSANFDAIKTIAPFLSFIGDVVPGPRVFAAFFGVQAWLSVVLVLFAAPRLFTPDLTGGALPLYFSKSVRRADYIGGKCAVLFVLVSGATWIPLTLVAGLRTALAKPGEVLDGVSLAGSVAVAGLALAAILTSLASAVAVHVRRSWLVPFLLLAIIGAGGRVSDTLRLTTGWKGFQALAPFELLEEITRWAFDIEGARGAFDLPHLDAGTAGLALLLWVVACGIVLFRRIRPVEVVR